jgi:YVTN family beta-propeller protein
MLHRTYTAASILSWYPPFYHSEPIHYSFSEILMKLSLGSMMLSLAVCSISAIAAAVPPLVLTSSSTIEIPQSSGKFDFLRVDLKRHRLVAAHEKDGTVDFFDLQKKTLLTRVKVGEAVDTAANADSSLYYHSVQEGERIAIVDAASLKEVKSIKMPGPTDAILFEPKNRKIYVTHDEGADVWVIDPTSAKIVATVKIPGVPEFMVYDESADRIYLNIKTKDVVAVIDPSSNTVIATWPTGVAKQPHGLAVDAATHRIFVAGGNAKMVAIDTHSGSIVGDTDIAAKVDQIAFDPSNGFVYSAGPDRMSVTQTAGSSLTLIGEFATAATAKNVAVDPDTHFIWTTYTDGKSSFAKSWVPPKP